MLLDRSVFSLLPWNSQYYSKARYKALHANISPQHLPVERKRILRFPQSIKMEINLICPLKKKKESLHTLGLLCQGLQGTFFHGDTNHKNAKLTKKTLDLENKASLKWMSKIRFQRMPCKTAFDTLSEQKWHRIQLSSSDQCFSWYQLVSLSQEEADKKLKAQFQGICGEEKCYGLWQNKKLYIKLLISTVSLTVSTSKNCFDVIKHLGPSGSTMSYFTSIVYETLYKGAGDAHYMLKSKHHCCNTTTLCLKTAHAHLPGKWTNRLLSIFEQH